MSNDFGFSVNQDDVKSPDPHLPDGKYPFKLVATEKKVSAKNNSNWFFKTEFEVMNGAAVGRKHFQNFNIGHTTESVKEMALADLKKFAQAIGYTGPLNSFDPFLHKPFVGTIKNKPQKDDADRMNSNIVKFENISTYSTAPPLPNVGTMTPAPQPVQVAQPASTIAANTPAPSTAPASAPWGAPKAA